MTKMINHVTRYPSARVIAAFCAALFVGAGGSVLRPTVQAQVNPIVAENDPLRPGATDWDISGTGDATIQGFTTDISVNTGETVSFKVKTDASSYKIDIYRLGYYGGDGARKVATVLPTATLPQCRHLKRRSSPCKRDADTR